MEAKEILSRVQGFFNDLMNPAPVAAADPAAPAMPTEYELKDGGKVMIDKLEVGGVVMIDGNPSLPGDIELADGTKITIGDNGVISAVTPAGAAPSADTAHPAFNAEEKFTALETMTAEKFASYETKFAAYEQRFADYEVKMAKANKVIEELLKLSQLIVDSPAVPADPAAKVSNSFKETKKEYSPILFN